MMANWFSTQHGTEAVKFAVQNDSACEHVEADIGSGVAVLCEDDSFGPVGRYAVCQACLDEHHKSRSEEKVTCDDCKQVKLRSETRQWRWYDFYAAQGDEALVICSTCKSLPKHKNRVRKDRQARDEELGYGY